MIMEKDYKELGEKTPMDLFNVKLAKKTQEFLRLRKPFDEPCARLDFRDKLEAMEKESQRRNGFVKFEDLKVDIDKFDLDKYANADRFVTEEDQEDVQDRVIEGSRTQVIIGHTISYRCKQRGHGISLFIPIREYLEMQKKVKGKKEE